jgi:hypothetical protein
VAFPPRERRFFTSRPIQGWLPLHVLGKPFSDFFEVFPFAILGLIAQHFDLSKSAIKNIIERELGRRRFSRRWLRHSLSESQKADRVPIASDFLTLLRRQARFSFSRIVTGNESWFLYLYQSDHMFAASQDEVIPRKTYNSGSDSYGNDFLQRS